MWWMTHVRYPLYTRLFESDKGGGGAADDTTDDDATDDTADPAGNNRGDASDGEKKFSQAEVDALITKRLDQAKERADRERKRAEEAADAKRLEDQAEWQKLADQRGTRISELEAEAAKVTDLEGQLEEYKVALKTHLKTQRDGVPKAVLSAIGKMSEPEQLAWLAEHRAEFVAGVGIPETPNGDAAGKPSRQDRINKYLEQATGRPAG